MIQVLMTNLFHMTLLPKLALDWLELGVEPHSIHQKIVILLVLGCWMRKLKRERAPHQMFLTGTCCNICLSRYTGDVRNCWSGYQSCSCSTQERQWIVSSSMQKEWLCLDTNQTCWAPASRSWPTLTLHAKRYVIKFGVRRAQANEPENMCGMLGIGIIGFNSECKKKLWTIYRS